MESFVQLIAFTIGILHFVPEFDLLLYLVVIYNLLYCVWFIDRYTVYDLRAWIFAYVFLFLRVLLECYHEELERLLIHMHNVCYDFVFDRSLCISVGLLRF